MLSEEIGEEAYFPGRLALPGYQIFAASPIFAHPVCSVHVDLPYNDVEWPSDEIDTRNPISFTVPIALPRSGAGLTVFDMSIEEFGPLSTTERTARLERRDRVHHAYEPGRIVIHSGHLVHQIAPFRTQDPSEIRLTLQGHAVRGQNGWQVFW
jgi:hypothetical protein